MRRMRSRKTERRRMIIIIITTTTTTTTIMRKGRIKSHTFLIFCKPG